MPVPVREDEKDVRIGETVMKKYFRVLLLIQAAFLAGCSSSNQDEELINRILSLPAKQYENYTFDPETALTGRISETPGFVLEYLNNMDGVDNYSSYTPTDEERALFASCLELLPEINRQIMEEKLAAVYFVENLYGSALADYFISREGDLYNILIINPEVMRHSMTEWLSYRENSAYKDSRGEITVHCGTEHTGLLYTLLHESTHIVDYHLNITPYAEYSSHLLTGASLDRDNPFLKDIWKDYNRVQRGYRTSFTSLVSFYGLGAGPSLELADAPRIYTDLMDSPFGSLYGSMSWAEDLAELVTWYWMTEVLGEPYTITLSSGAEGSRDNQSWSPMDNEGVRRRFQLLETEFLRTP